MQPTSTAAGTGMGLSITVRREKSKIWSHIRQKWLVETPEETVRQEYLLILVNEYGFSLDQISATGCPE